MLIQLFTYMTIFSIHVTVVCVFYVTVYSVTVVCAAPDGEMVEMSGAGS
jgi:hypothetical protein